MKKFVSAALLALCMMWTLLPTAALAAGTGAIQSGMDGIGTLNKVYFGKYTTFDVPWLVLDADGVNAFLLSEYLLGKSEFRDRETYYTGGPLNAKMDELYNDGPNTLFTANERGAIVVKTNLICADGPEDDPASPAVPTAYLYPLSHNEAAALTWGSAVLQAKEITTQSGDAERWWLRSHHRDAYYAGPQAVSGAENPDGAGEVGIYERDYLLGVRPAFNLDPSKVLFASAATGGKSANGMDGGLGAVSASTPTEWKLTLEDSSRSGFTARSASVVGNVLTLSYTGAKTGANEFISAIIEDENGNITHYGRILSNVPAQGTATIRLPGDMTGKTLSVFSEQYNGDPKTDCASRLQVIIAPIVITAQPTDQHVAQDQRATFTLSAAGAGLTYQWYVNRNDGRNWQKLDGETAASYTSPEAELSNDGFRYFCRVTDAYARTLDSQIATLRVSKAVLAPQTGDPSTPTLWLCLYLLGGAGLLALWRSKRRRA